MCCIPVLTRVLELSDQAREYLIVMLIVLSYYIFLQAFNCLFIVGILRAGGDTRYGLFADVGTLWGIAVLWGAIAAFAFHASLPVVYILLTSDEIFKIPLVLWRYKSGKWLKNVTREQAKEREITQETA